MSKLALKLSLSPLVMGLYLCTCILFTAPNPVLSLLIFFGFIFHLFLYLSFYKETLNWRSSMARVYFMTGGVSWVATLVFILVYLHDVHLSWLIGFDWFILYIAGLFLTYIINRWLHFHTYHLQPQKDILKKALCITDSTINMDVPIKIEAIIRQEFISVYHTILDEDASPRAEIPPSLMDYLTREIIDGIFLYLPNYNSIELSVIVDQLASLGVDIFVIKPGNDIEWPYFKTMQTLKGLSVLQLSQHVYTPFSIIVSEVNDIIGALIGLSLTVLFGVFIAFAIKLTDGGNVLFLQQRVGYNGRIFTFYKFRSMVVDAEKQIDQLKAYNQMYGHIFKIKNDPRVTRIGHWLRKTSLDELPQFMNVLKGEMSLIGTRPPLVSEFTKYEPRHKYRLSFKTGITGLWQVSGRNDIEDFEDITDLDNRYIKEWSFKNDIYILFKTIEVVINRKGAH